MALWIIAAFVGYFVKGICGFANTLVLTGIMSFGTENVNISPVDLILSYASNSAMAYRERAHIRLKAVLPVATLFMLGCIPGALMLKSGNAEIIKIFAGAAIILAAVTMLIQKKIKAKLQTQAIPDGPEKNSDSNSSSLSGKIITFFIALISGILSGMYGIGAMISICVSRLTKNSHEFKANMSLIFFAEGTFRLILYIIFGILTGEVFLKALILLPFSLAGLFSGMKLSDRIDESKTGYVVIFFLILSGIVLIANNL